ncbi:hypothetical protein [Actinoalloteichus sp. GBA129-24]|uniref:hypothetical protein n=1 Tax=Actinoalloteichus sp. GBA129-24 TaxID=1612551 RepID=UPI00095058FA|nr:hypothetical protein [Actinoalloteichus sp. GBA129-24]APU22889.1 hypothetical protein UA75_24535 [Actinoalloteichus sp. GBA129-24]
MNGNTERLGTTNANFEGRTAHQLREQLDAQGHGGDFNEAFRQWSDVAADFDRIGEYLDTAIKKAAAAHTGTAADASQAAVTPLAEYTRQAREQALAIGSTVSVQGLAHRSVRWDTPENPAAGPPAKEGFESFLPSEWTGHSDRVDVYEEENRVARQAMSAYQDESNARLQSIPAFAPPPPADYALGSDAIATPLENGDPSLSPSSPGGGNDGGPGGGWTSPNNALPAGPDGSGGSGGSGSGFGGGSGGIAGPDGSNGGGSRPGGYGPAPAPGIGTDSNAPGGGPSVPVAPGGNLPHPGGYPPGGPPPGQGGFAPGGGFGGPGVPGGGRAGGPGGPPGGRPGGFGPGGGPGGRVPGGLNGGRMPGGFGPGAGFGPGGPGSPGGGFGPGGPSGVGGSSGGRLPGGGFGPAGGGAAGGAGMAGGGAGGRGGDGEEDKEHQRADYLLEDADVFGDDRKVAPPVFGA